MIKIKIKGAKEELRRINDEIYFNSLNIIFENYICPIIENVYFSVYLFNQNENSIKRSLRGGNKSMFNKADYKESFNCFTTFDSNSYLSWNNKNMYYNFPNKLNFLTNLLTDIQEYFNYFENNEKYIFPYFIQLSKKLTDYFKKFLNEKLFSFTKNIQNFLKSTKDIKKLITPILEQNISHKSLASQNLEICESDFISLLEVNYNVILTFFEGFKIIETIDKKQILDIIDENVNIMREIIEEFFNDNLITVIYPNNDIKEDLLSNLRKGIIEKTLKFYELIYEYLDLQKLWENYEKYTKVILHYYNIKYIHNELIILIIFLD